MNLARILFLDDHLPTLDTYPMFFVKPLYILDFKDIVTNHTFDLTKFWLNFFQESGSKEPVSALRRTSTYVFCTLNKK